MGLERIAIFAIWLIYCVIERLMIILDLETYMANSSLLDKIYS